MGDHDISSAVFSLAYFSLYCTETCLYHLKYVRHLIHWMSEYKLPKGFLLV